MAGKVWHGGAGSGEFMHGVAGMAGSVVFRCVLFRSVNVCIGMARQERSG